MPPLVDFLGIRGARQHNLQNISCDIPHNHLIVITGVSGSGKSSRAFGHGAVPPRRGGFARGV